MRLLEDWEKTKAAALKGLERSGWSHDQCSSDLLAVLPPGSEDPAADLLSAVSVLSAWYQAGIRAQVIDEVQECGQPQPEERPFCTPAAEVIWERIRSFQFALPDLEKRWLVRCYRAGYVLSPKVIVEALQFGESKKNAALQPLIALVAGSLGRWLAGFCPEWGYVLPEVLSERYLLGKPAERVAALTALRIVQPSTARSLLASTWPRESNSDRLKLLEAFGSRSLTEDEPFLVQLLDELDRQGIAEGSATRQLKQLITRTLLKNQTSATWSSWVAQLSRYWKGKVVLPDAQDECLQQQWMSFYGITAKGEGSALIIQYWSVLLSMLPPSIWVAAFEESPKLIVKALEEGPYLGHLSKNQVNNALISATRTYKDSIWAEALIGSAGVEDAFALFELLPAEKRETYLMGNRSIVARITWDAPSLQFDWSPEFSNWVLRNWYERLVLGDTKTSQVLMNMAIFMHPTVRPSTIPGPYDPVYIREEWLQKVVRPLEKILAVKALL